MKTRFGLALALLLAAPSLAHAQELEDRSPRIMANLALGFGGELDIFTSSAAGTNHGETDLDASVGFDARFDLPILDFLAIGGMFEFLSVEPETISGPLGTVFDFEREETFSFDAYVRARWVFEAIAETLFVEPYVLLPIGLTLAVLPDDDGSGDDVWAGWNTAALFGGQLLHSSGFGGYLELGWRHAEVYYERGSTDVAYVTNEFAMNLGFVYVIGGSG